MSKLEATDTCTTHTGGPPPAARPTWQNTCQQKSGGCLCEVEVRSSDPRLQHQTCNYLFIEAQHLQPALKSVMMDYLLFSNYRISHKNENFKANVYYLVWNDLSVPFSGFWAPFVPVSWCRNLCIGQHVSMWTCSVQIWTCFAAK